MYYIALKICIGGPFLQDCLYCYSRQIISAVTNESLIPYNLKKSTRNKEPLILYNLMPTQTNQKKKEKKRVKYSSVFRTKDFVPHKYKQYKYM